MATGSKSARSRPAEGDVFLTSAMIVGRWPRSRAAQKSRTAGAPASFASSVLTGVWRFRAATSWRFAATMLARISLTNIAHGMSPTIPIHSRTEISSMILEEREWLVDWQSEIALNGLAYLLVFAGGAGVVGLIFAWRPRLAGELRPTPAQERPALSGIDVAVVFLLLIVFFGFGVDFFSSILV